MKSSTLALGFALSVLAGLAPIARFPAAAESAPKLTGFLRTNTDPASNKTVYRLEIEGGTDSLFLRGQTLSGFNPGSHLLVQGPIRTELAFSQPGGTSGSQNTNGSSWQVFMDVLKARQITSPFGLNDPEGAIYAWQQTNQYRAPGFDAYFPDDLEGAERLDAWWKATNPEGTRQISQSDEEIMDLLRHGLRRGKLHTLPLLRWFGNRYIWGQSPQNPEAIELMYHAADPKQVTRTDVRYWAVYFGLSVVQTKTAAILHALAEIAVAVDDPNDLSRIAWGVKSQKAEFLPYLEPFLASADLHTQDKARIVRRIVDEELNAFEWATEQARQRAQAKYADQLPAFRRKLTEGDSKERKSTLDDIMRERIYLIMDESYLDAFDACSKDEQEAVRLAMVRIVGEHWIWNAKDQSQKAIDQMLRLTHDPSPSVRYYAVYSGLSTVRQKPDPVVRRLVEMMLKDPDRELSQRIVWGFRSDRESAGRVLTEYAKDTDPKIAKAAEAAYRAVTGQDLPSR